ncbi:MAG: CapA family protein [Anaerolineales bacterium]
MSQRGSFSRHPLRTLGVPCLLLLLSACSPLPSAVGGPTPTPPPMASATSTPQVTSVWIAPGLPAALRQTIQLPPGFSSAADPASASLRLTVGGRRSLSAWVYALVTPFPTIPDGVSWDDLRSDWQGGSSGPFAGQPVLLSQETLSVLSAVWKAPAPSATLVLPADQILAYAWAHRPAWAIVPFESIEPRWKVLEVDGLSPIHKQFSAADYALTVSVGIDGPEPQAASLVKALQSSVPASNRDPAKLTTLVMTGVTALVRATAWTMEQKGIDYPARDIGDWLRDADITHISNEVSFAAGCPYPNRDQINLFFCSDPRYIQLLEDVGTDVVELTGNHLNDWGTSADRYTLQLYRQRGWAYYGGGENLEEARKPVILTDHGNRIAFIGCNPVGPDFDWATADGPGSAPCDLDYMSAQIRELRNQGILPIATFQYYEYYTFPPRPNQVRDFQAMAEAGAVIVSGSQSHVPQAMDFHDGAFIHYGLGNLFFDQMLYRNQSGQIVPGTRWEFIDRHVFYAGRYLGTEILTAMLEDYARPRPMTTAERAALLSQAFAASGW